MVELNRMGLGRTGDAVGSYFVATSGLIQITVTGLVGASNAGGTVTKTAANGWGTAGYTSVESITGDGYIEWTATDNNTDRVVGLSTTDIDQNYNTVEFGFSLESGGNIIDTWESGTSPTGVLGNWTAGVTVFKIAREGTQIKYYIDGSVAYTSAVTAPVGALFVDTAMYTNGSTIGPITMSQ